MPSRLINGAVAALIAWSVTNSKWIALVVFGVAAGLSSNKFKWFDEIVKAIKDEVAKAKNASSSPSAATSTSTQSSDAAQSPAAKLAANLKAKVLANIAAKQGAPSMLKNKNDAAGYARTDKISMASTFPAVLATVLEQPRKEISMFVKLIIAVVIGGAAGFMTQNPSVAIGVFVAETPDSIKALEREAKWIDAGVAAGAGCVALVSGEAIFE